MIGDSASVTSMVESPVPAEWEPGIYIAETASRPADSAARRGSGAGGWRRLGETGPRTADTECRANGTDRAETRQTIEFPAMVSSLESGQTARLTVSDVDECILQLTDFTTRTLRSTSLENIGIRMQLLDVYGESIETGKQPEQLKVGGDADKPETGRLRGANGEDTGAVFRVRWC